MNDYAHPRAHRERKVCPYMHARTAASTSNNATTATEEQNGMKGQNRGTQNEQRREERTGEATHN